MNAFILVQVPFDRDGFNNADEVCRLEPRLISVGSIAAVKPLVVNGCSKSYCEISFNRWGIAVQVGFDKMIELIRRWGTVHELGGGDWM